MRAAIAGLLLLFVAFATAAEVPEVVVGPAMIRFEGARMFAPEKLADVVTNEIRDFVRSGFDEIHAEDAADRLHSFYLAEGHANATVDYVSEPAEAKRGLVRFAVEEGPRIVLGEVKVKGNEAVPDETLLAFVRRREGWFGSPVLVRTRLEADLGAMADYYVQNGWLGVEITSPKLKLKGEPGDTEVVTKVVVRISEGPRTWFRAEDMVLEGSRPEKEPALREAVRELVAKERGEQDEIPYRPGLRYRVRAALLDVYGSTGFPFARVDVREELSPDRTRMRLVCTIDEGERARVGHIEIEGNRGVRDFFVRRELELDRKLPVEQGGTIDSGEFYDAGRLRNAQIGLLGTGLFNSVRIDPVPVEGDPRRVDLHVKLREKVLKAVDLRVGWGSYEQLRFGMTATHRAWDGIAELLGSDWAPSVLDARVDLEASTRHARIGAQLRERRVLDTRWESALVVGFEARENVSYSYNRAGVRLAFGRKLVHYDPRLRVEAAWTWNRTDIVDVDADLPDDLAETVNLSSLSLGLIGNWRDDPVWPSRGGRASAHVEVADERLGGDVSFVRLKVAGDVYLPLDEEQAWVLGIAARGGVLFPFGDTDEIPLSERFFSGGSTSVRSFAEQELGPKDDGSPEGGEAELVANVELRFPIWKIVHGAAFVDAGNVYRKSGDFDPGDVELGIGAGIRLRTPVGPLRLDWGWNPDPGEDDPDWTIHFSVGFAF